jgi:pantetheine-phosphate adenylyltransferase
MQKHVYKLASIGGTFGAFHQGHKDYIDLAFALAKRVQIGINSQSYAQTYKQYDVSPLEQRLKALNEYLAEKHFSKRLCAIMVYENLNDFHRALLEPSVDCVVITDEYLETATMMNKERIVKGANAVLKPNTFINTAGHAHHRRDLCCE